MTTRTNATPPTPIEAATADLEHVLAVSSESLHRKHACSTQISLAEFRRMLVLYFHDKSLRDWCRIFAVPESAVEGHHDHGGES